MKHNLALALALLLIATGAHAYNEQPTLPTSAPLIATDSSGHPFAVTPGSAAATIARTAVAAGPAVASYAALNGFGDSYLYGLGGTNPNVTGMLSILARDMPVANWNNYGVSGTTANTITTSAFASFSISNLFLQ